MPRWSEAAVRAVLVLISTAALTCLLVRLTPGYGVDERTADASLGEETRAGIARDAGLQWGHSSVYGTPIAGLLAERWPATLATVSAGLVAAWCLAIPAVLVPFALRLERLRAIPDLGATLLMTTPAALLAVIAFLLRLPAAMVVAAAVFPKIHSFLRNRFEAARLAPHVIAAESRGLPPARIGFHYVLRPEAAELAALGAVSFRLALSAAIPAEVFCDVPGLGQLVWKAAQGRDLALILPLTILFAAAFQAANALAWLAPARRAA